jgi:hypothetical protein
MGRGAMRRCVVKAPLRSHIRRITRDRIAMNHR